MKGELHQKWEVGEVVFVGPMGKTGVVVDVREHEWLGETVYEVKVRKTEDNGTAYESWMLGTYLRKESQPWRSD